MKIVKARVLHDYGWIVRFWLDDGSHVDRDFAFVSGPVFDPIWKDRRRFKSVKIVDGYPTWIGPDGNVVDLCPDAVLRGGLGRGRPMRFAIVGPAGTLISGRGVKSL
jgi:hypothetical protein